MSFTNVVLIGVYSLIAIYTPASGQKVIQFGRECVTPQGANGFCVNLIQCQSLLILAQDSEKNSEYLLESWCSGSGQKSVVCCPTTELRSDIDNIADTLLPSREICGQQMSKKILNGMVTTIEEFPWTVQLWYSKSDNKTTNACAGSLINADHVVTAAHCVNPLFLGQSQFDKVRLGEWNTTSLIDCNEEGDCADPVEDIAVAEIFEHEAYNPRSLSKENDIAVIRLARKVSYSEYIRPICLPTGNIGNTSLDNVNFTVAGWGRTETAAKSDVKLKVKLMGVSNEFCANAYGAHDSIISSRHICAGGKLGTDTCRGDSGAPLMAFDDSDRQQQFWYLAGVLSFGPQECGKEGVPGVYVRASKLSDWIISKLR